MTAVIVPFPAPGAPARAVTRLRLPRRSWLRLPWWWPPRLRARLAFLEAESDYYRQRGDDILTVLRAVAGLPPRRPEVPGA
jgi:hypothetical protein